MRASPVPSIAVSDSSVPSSTAPAAPIDPIAPQAAPKDAAPTEAAALAASAGADKPAADEPAAAIAELSPADVAVKLAELFPALFAAVPNTPPKPIKLRIQSDIQARAPGLFTRRSLSPFLHRHTTTTSYLKALVASAHRYDLDGAPAGEVSDEHRQAAQAELDRRWAIVQARRAAERAAQRAAAPEAPAAGTPSKPRPAGRDGRRQDRPPRDRRERRGRPGARDGHGARDASSQRPAPAPAPAHVPLPDDPARRERALLLRAFESSTLSRANFCALKRIAPDQLDALLEQARSEAGAGPPRAARAR
ncbi:MAG: ProQ/FinO family protein [Burkholderiaceae bacterium]